MIRGLILWVLITGTAMAQEFVVTERWQPAAAVVTRTKVKRVERVRMRWNISGDWTPTESQTRGHLEREHGVSTDGMSHQQMLDLHDSLHDGRSRTVLRQDVRVRSSCPGGVCPPQQRFYRVR